MKKVLFMGAIAAMLLGTASCSNDMEPAMGDNTVQFTIELPGAIESRAISDGLTANKLTVAVYDANGNELTDLKVNKDIPHQTTVEFKLVKGQTYSFAFWAQAEDAPYSFSTATKTVTVDYGEGKVDCNNESRDAFYAYKTYEVTGPVNETIKLTRPFAQLNFGADDLEDAVKAGITPSESQVVVSKVGTAFNLATGKTEGEQENVTFKLAAIPTDTDPKYVVGENEYGKLVVNNKDYGWLAMNYFLAPGDDAIIEATMTVKTNKADVVVPATNVPVKKNHRTNIVGSLFTEDANFNVIIDEQFDADFNIYENYKVYNVDEDANFAEILNEINTNQPERVVINIADGAKLTYTIPSARYAMIDENNTKTKEISFIGAGKEQSILHVDGNGVSGIKITNGANVIFRNLTLTDDTRYNYENGNNAWEFAYLELQGNMFFENVKISDGVQTEGNDSQMTFCDCDFISDGNSKRNPEKQSDEYAIWISSGLVKFTNCTFTGFRAAKIHNCYGTVVRNVYFKKCNFHDISKKPGVVIGKITAPSIVSIVDCQFINTQPGDQGKYKYESDTDISAFNLIDENNLVQHD